MSVRHLILVLGDQLTLDNPALVGFDSTLDRILMVEAPQEAQHVWSHKARIALFLSAMRHFALTLDAHQMPCIYLKLGEHAHTSLASAWAFYVDTLKPQAVRVCQPGDYRVLQQLNNCAQTANIPLEVLEDTHFMCSTDVFRQWAGSLKSLRMEFFYRMMRKQHGILMQGDQPEGGTWNFDAENRLSFGKQGPGATPAMPPVNVDAVTHHVLADVEHYFPDHPGSLAHFCWPVTRQEALTFLQTFVEEKLALFGAYQDAMWQGDMTQSPFLWHSLLASSLNLKLLDPREVIAAAVNAYHQRKLPLASVEGFVRQILGWREFIRGVYWLDMPQLAEANHYGHQRDLPVWFWTGNTQMNCMRQTIQQTMQYGYAHHIQRLMVTGLFGLLAEIQPSQVEAWYLAVYVDAVDWVELPNTAGMALYANGGRFTSKPYVASGAYINRMSNYCKHCRYRPEVKTGPKACPMTTLYWHFLMRHYDDFARNPRTSLMVKHVDKLGGEQAEAIQLHANTLLQNLNEV